jgi:hypothetical protein
MLNPATTTYNFVAILQGIPVRPVYTAQDMEGLEHVTQEVGWLAKPMCSHVQTVDASLHTTWQRPCYSTMLAATAATSAAHSMLIPYWPGKCCSDTAAAAPLVQGYAPCCVHNTLAVMHAYSTVQLLLLLLLSPANMCPVASLAAAAWCVPLLAGPLCHHVHCQALDHTAVRRLLNSRGVQRIL